MDDYLTTAEAAALVGLKPDTILHECSRGGLADIAVKRGRDWWIPRDGFARWAKSRRPRGRPKKPLKSRTKT